MAHKTYPTTVRLTEMERATLMRTGLTLRQIVSLGFQAASRRGAADDPDTNPRPTYPVGNDDGLRAEIGQLRAQLAQLADRFDHPRRAPITPPARPATSTSTRTTSTSATPDSSPTSTSTPARITYTAIRDALGQPVGHLFTAADLRAAFGLQTGQWVPRLMALEACGLIERVGRASTVGRPWQFRLASVPESRLCDEGECGHDEHQDQLASV